MKKNVILVFVLPLLMSMVMGESNKDINKNSFDFLTCKAEDYQSNEKIFLKNIKLGDSDSYKYSKVYTQLGYDGSNCFLRFAMAVSGNINSISYSLDVNNENYKLGNKNVSTLYRSISANGKNYYYSENLNSITEDKNEASSDYLWSCYTIKFKDEHHLYSSLSLIPSINGEILDNKAISLQDEINGDYTYSFGNLDLANVGLEKDNYSYNQTMNITGSLDNSNTNYESVYAHNFILSDSEGYLNANPFNGRKNATEFNAKNAGGQNLPKAVAKSIGSNYLHYLYNGAGATSTFTSDATFAGKLVIRAATGYLTSTAAGFTTGDMQFNKVFDVLVNGYKVEVKDDVILPGKAGNYGDAMGNFVNIPLDAFFIKGDNKIEIISKKPLKEDGTLLYKDPGTNGTQSSPSLDSVEVYKYKVCANDVETKLVAQKCLENGSETLIFNDYGKVMSKVLPMYGSHVITGTKVSESLGSLELSNVHCERCNEVLNKHITTSNYIDITSDNLGGTNGTYNGKDIRPVKMIDNTVSSPNVKALANTALNGNLARQFYGGTYAEVKVNVETSFVGSVVIKAASGYNYLVNDSFTTWGTGDMQFNQVFALTVNNNAISIDDGATLKGNDNDGKGFTNKSSGEGYALAMGNWMYIIIDNVSFISGENVIRLTSLRHSYKDKGGDMSTAALDTIGIFNETFTK